jgi:hypothetical protein
MFRNLGVGMSVLAFAAAPAAGQTSTNQSAVTQTGTGNQANVDNNRPGNDNNASTVVQNGIANLADVEQVSDLNISRVRQIGDDNRADHRQNGNRNTADTEQNGNRHVSNVVQRGDDHLAIVLQSGGNRNSSTVRQSEDSTGRRLTARVTQHGSDNVSEVVENGSDHVVRVVQGSAQTLPSQGNRSQISSAGNGNSVELFQFEGTAAAGNVSTISQNGSASSASVALRGFGNASGVNQSGNNNFARVTMLGGGAGTVLDAETGRGEGNRSAVTQSGSGVAAAVTAGALTAGEGLGNLTTVQQTGTGTVVAAGRNHRADVWQYGTYETIAIRQADSSPDRPTQQPTEYSDGTRGRAVANIAQRSLRGSIDVRQFGDSNARVTQGLGSRSVAQVNQVDAGDFEVAVPEQTLRAFNRAVVAQNGDGNRIYVGQDSINASATIFQTVGSSSNAITIFQGEPVAEVAVVGELNQPKRTGSGTLNLTAQVTQSGTRNNGFVGQWGSNLQATIEQRGSGTEARLNIVGIEQRGQSNRATARQTAGVGPSAATDPASGQSGDERFFAGGTRSAEIRIFQQNTGNSATVEQRGRGQVALLVQTGDSNIGSILQLEDAANATAILRQSGNRNSYSIEQSRAGEYISVSQSGNDNTVSNVIRRGPGT